jgi:hypothetical protein
MVWRFLFTAWFHRMIVSPVRNFTLILAAVAALGGCGLLRQPPPPTPLEVSWNRYQLCIHQTREATQQCERLRLAYEAQLNRAPR